MKFAPALVLVLLVGNSAFAKAQVPVEPSTESPASRSGEAPTEGSDDDHAHDEGGETATESGLGEPPSDVPLDEPPPAEDGYVLGHSELRLNLAASPLSLEPSPAHEERPLHQDLELALRLPTYDFDGVSFISASRSIITGVLETYCATGLLLPDEEGFQTVDVILGTGCLLGATTLFVMGIRKLLHPSEERRAVERLARFEALRSGEGLNDEDITLFENELRGAARRDRRRRIIEIIFGGLNIVATATLAGLTARGRIHSTTGTSIATGTAALGLLSLSSIFVRSPSERAWSNYEAR